MLYTTIALFGIAALIGILILKNWLTSAHTSRTVVYAHGIFAAIALVLLLIYTLKDPSRSLIVSVSLFALAAIGGFYMFARDLKGKYSPTAVAVIHGLVAVAGFLLLIFYVI